MKRIYNINGNISRVSRRRFTRRRRSTVRHPRLVGVLAALCLLVVATSAVTVHIYRAINRPDLTAVSLSSPTANATEPSGKPFGIAEGDTLTGLTNAQLQHTLG